jgi:hypothetical protein
MPIPQDDDTPFSIPDDINSPTQPGDPNGNGGQIPQDYPQTDTNMDDDEAYQEGNAAAAGVDFPAGSGPSSRDDNDDHTLYPYETPADQITDNRLEDDELPDDEPLPEDVPPEPDEGADDPDAPDRPIITAA